jgi:hypothetical protein
MRSTLATSTWSSRSSRRRWCGTFLASTIGQIEGREPLLSWLAQLGSIGFWLVDHDVFASDQHACAVSTMGARRDNVDVQMCTLGRWSRRDRSTER